MHREPNALNSRLRINHVEVQITETCNNNCLYCYAGMPKTKQPREMSVETFWRVVDGLRSEAEVGLLSLSGGEPTLHRDFLRIVGIARDAFPDSRLHLQTNARSFKSKAKCLALWAIGLDTINVSLQSVVPDVHEKLDGIPGRYAEVVTGLINLLEVQSVHGRPRVAVNITLSRLNAPTFVETVAWLAELGVEGVTSNAMRPTVWNTALRKIHLADAEISNLFAEARREATRRGRGFKALHSFDLCAYDGRRDGNEHYVCPIGRRILGIDVAGTVLTCNNIQSKDLREAGSLMAGQSIRAIWQGKLMNEFRQGAHLPEECRKCDQLAACGGRCPAIPQETGTQNGSDIDG